MSSEFVTYEQALALKELGFDEKCFGWYHKGRFSTMQMYMTLDDIRLNDRNCFAPLIQQAFRFFREKYGLYGEIFSQLLPSGNRSFAYKVMSLESVIDGFESYEEAEQACLNKLIEIAKESKQ